MKQGWAMALAAAVVGWSLWAAALGDDDGKHIMRVKDDTLMQGKQAFVMRAIETPGIANAGMAHTDLAVALARVAEVGANTVCFDAPGLSADGTSIDPDALKSIDALMEALNYQRMGAICRVFAADGPKDAAYRKTVLETVARTLKPENRMIYWIDGPDADAMAKAFKKIAPALVVASEKDGDMDVVTAVPVSAPAKPALVFGAVPGAALRASVHCVMPAGDASYQAFDTAMADPLESKPWTPDNSKLSEQERADGFVSLFDGKTLDGWWMLGVNKNGFAVNDGTIEWKSVGGQALYTHDRYDNFVLRIEWKINPRGNSGIYIRAPRSGRQSKIGMEIQVQGDAGEPVTFQTTASIYSVIAPTKNASKPAGEWNAMEITADGPHVKVVLNGETVQDANLDQSDELRVRLRRGFIGLQDHGCYVAYRNIRIKKL